MSKIQLINSIIDELDTLNYGDEAKLHAIKSRGEMIVRNIFGEISKYLEDIKNTDFYPLLYPSSPEFKRQQWDMGTKQLRNVFNTMKEEILLFDKSVAKPPTDLKGEELGNQIFIVHGHDEIMKQSVARILEKLGLEPIILHEKPNIGRTIIEKFTDYSAVGFAVVLLSPDDIAYARNGNPEEHKFRARQNVILELGYFLGKLGRERVVSLFDSDEKFEMPTDYSGVLFVPFDKTGRWQFELIKELKACGYKVDANKLLQ